ncbi:MAG: heme-binding protein [Methylovulum sp.]|nr:heme-binding protein [Methylovulum sp.]
MGTFANLQAAANTAAGLATGGYGLPMWITTVDENGTICNVTTSNSEVAGGGANDWNVDTPVGGSNKQWLGSRVISAQKANTANAFSVNGYSIASANLYSAVSSGSLYGLQHSNPVDASRAYLGNAARYGSKNDPLRNQRIGGVNVFGGGLAIYKDDGTKVGAVGVSGDTSCRDHAFAWEVRKALATTLAGLQPKAPLGITSFNAAPDAVGGAAAVVALLNAAGGAAVGDELIIVANGTDGAQGKGIDAADSNNVVGSKTYWSAWSQPGCPITALTHESYIFVQ